MTTSSRWQRLLLLLRSRQTDANQGITLVECIMAIAVISLTTAMITPPLFLAAATRLQNQRAEQALQIAQGEIDRIRFLVERQQHIPSALPATVTGTSLANVGAPTGFTATVQTTVRQGNQNCQTYDGQQVPRTQALLVDTDGDCRGDFAMQMFRTVGVTPRSEVSVIPGDGRRNRPGSFCIMVRVYGKPAIENAQNGGLLATQPASLLFTSGEGDQRTQPLAVLTTPITWSDRAFSADSIRDSNGRC